MTYHELTVLIPCHSLEDFPSDLGEQPSEGLLNAFAVLWHPALMAAAGAIPRWRRADEVHSVQADRLYILPTASNDWVSHGWSEDTRKAGATVVSGVTEREELLRQALAGLDSVPDVDPDLAADFLAFGVCYLLTELLTRKMRNFSHVDEVHLQREAVAAARAAVQNDRVAAETHLRYCFEMLLECRERFYPVDCYLIDLCLVSQKYAGEHLRKRLELPTPLSLLSTASDWQQITADDPAVHEQVRNLWRDGRIELLGGEWRETATPLMSTQSEIWQLQRGLQTYRTLFDRTPTTWGRKRFGVDPSLPMLISRSGMSAGLHFVIDDGIYPDQEHSKLRWTGCDGTVIDAFSRIPLAADSASSLLRFPSRMAESMDHDQTAAIAFAAWPELRTPWLDDLRRMSKYAPVLGRFVTFRQFFDAGEMPGKMVEYKPSEYLTPNLVQAVAREEPDAISRHVDYWERRARFESLEWCHNLAGLLQRGAIDAQSHAELQESVEAADPDAAAEVREETDGVLAELATRAPLQLAEILAHQGTDGAGRLVMNPLSFPRCVTVRWPDDLPLPSASEPIRARQADDRARTVVFDVPACGFAWIPAGQSIEDRPPAGKTPMAEELLLRNDYLEVALSDVTGGIGQIRTYERGGNRISQQLAYRFPRERTITIGEGEQEETYRSYYSEMRMREARILSAGPAVGEIETVGEIVNQQQNKLLAEYRQLTRVVRGRPFVEVEIELDCHKRPDGDPWTNYYGARFAWKYETVALSASLHQGAHPVNTERIEAPQFLELADDAARTTILPCGLPFHRKTGPRMLDTLMIVAGETRRRFRFAIAVDQLYPFQSALDVAAPSLSVTTTNSPPKGATTGWLFHLSAGNVQLTRLLPLFSGETASDGLGCGRSPDRATPGVYCPVGRNRGPRESTVIRCFRSPIAARQVDFVGQTIHKLEIEGAASGWTSARMKCVISRCDGVKKCEKYEECEKSDPQWLAAPRRGAPFEFRHSDFEFFPSTLDPGPSARSMWPSSAETERLLQDAAAGNANAASDLLEQHRAALRRMIALRLDRGVARRIDASDVVQDVLFEASRRLADYLQDPRMPFHLWLRHLALDRMIDVHRRHHAQRRDVGRERPLQAAANSGKSSLDLAAQVQDQELTPAAAALRKELAGRFLEALDQLDEQDREIILLRHVEQLGNSEAAEALGLAPAAAGMRYLRALRRLRSLLSDPPSVG